MFGLALVDFTTSDFKATELENETALMTELERLRPAEIIYPAANAALGRLLAGGNPPQTPPRRGTETQTASEITPEEVGSVAAWNLRWVLNGYDDWVFAAETAQFTLRDHFKVASLDGFGLKDRAAAIGAAGAVLHDLTQHVQRDVAHLTRLSFYRCTDFLVLDAATLRNLEILEPLHRDAPKPGSLYAAVNRTMTPMGARRLRDWLSQPLAAVDPVQRRQAAVGAWMDNPRALESFRERLIEVRDMERTINRLSAGTGNARDLLALRLALEQIPALKEILKSVGQASSLSPISLRELPKLNDGAERNETGAMPVQPLSELESQLTELPDLVELISRAIVDQPPLAVKEGGLIRDGFDANLDELRNASREGKDWIAKLQLREIERTGIASLKVRFNSVFGYYLEVTRANLDKVPPHYVRKQTIANGERFITPELKEMEGKILGAEERSIKLEYELFLRVREAVIAQLAAIQRSASALAQLDVLAAFAETPRLFNYFRPQIGKEGLLQNPDGRHPGLYPRLTPGRSVPHAARPATPPRIIPPSPPPAGERGNAPRDSVTEPSGTANPHPRPP